MDGEVCGEEHSPTSKKEGYNVRNSTSAKK